MATSEQLSRMIGKSPCDFKQINEINMNGQCLRQTITLEGHDATVPVYEMDIEDVEYRDADFEDISGITACRTEIWAARFVKKFAKLPCMRRLRKQRLLLPCILPVPVYHEITKAETDDMIVRRPEITRRRARSFSTFETLVSESREPCTPMSSYCAMNSCSEVRACLFCGDSQFIDDHMCLACYGHLRRVKERLMCIEPNPGPTHRGGPRLGNRGDNRKKPRMVARQERQDDEKEQGYKDAQRQKRKEMLHPPFRQRSASESSLLSFTNSVEPTVRAPEIKAPPELPPLIRQAPAMDYVEPVHGLEAELAAEIDKRTAINKKRRMADHEYVGSRFERKDPVPSVPGAGESKGVPPADEPAADESMRQTIDTCYTNIVSQHWRYVTYTLPQWRVAASLVALWAAVMLYVASGVDRVDCAEVSQSAVVSAFGFVGKIIPTWVLDVQSWTQGAAQAFCTVTVEYPRWYLWPYVQVAALVALWATVEFRLIIWDRVAKPATVRRDATYDGRIAIMRNIESQKDDVVCDYRRTVLSSRYLLSNVQTRHVSVVQATETVRNGLGVPGRLTEEVDKFIKFNTGVHTSAFDFYSPADTAMFVTDLQAARACDHYSDFGKPPVAVLCLLFLMHLIICAGSIMAFVLSMLLTCCLNWPYLLRGLYSLTVQRAVSVIILQLSGTWVAASGVMFFLILTSMIVPTFIQPMFSVLLRSCRWLIDACLERFVILSASGSVLIWTRFHQGLMLLSKHGWQTVTTLSGAVKNCYELGTGVDVYYDENTISSMPSSNVKPVPSSSIHASFDPAPTSISVPSVPSLH